MKCSLSLHLKWKHEKAGERRTHAFPLHLMLMSQTVIAQPYCGVIYEITCHSFIYAYPGATRKNWNVKSKSSSNVTIVQKGYYSKKSVGTPFPPHYTPVEQWAAHISHEYRGKYAVAHGGKILWKNSKHVLD